MQARNSKYPVLYGEQHLGSYDYTVMSNVGTVS